MAFGLTYASTDILCKRLSELVLVPYEDLQEAFKTITNEEVARIARNNKEEVI